jgi:hypothetical protein
MSDQTNYGIVGDIKGVQNLAVGANAKIDVTGIQLQLADKLDALADAVQGYEGPEETRHKLLAAHDEVLAQLQQPEPDRSRILTTLSAIARTAGSASTIVTAATALASAVGALL